MYKIKYISFFIYQVFLLHSVYSYFSKPIFIIKSYKVPNYLYIVPSYIINFNQIFIKLS